MEHCTVRKPFFCFMILASMAVLIFAIMGFLAARVNPNDNTIFLYAALGLPFTILFALILVIYFAFKRSYYFLISLLAIVINFQFITYNFSIGRIFNVNPSVESHKIKVATYNVHSFNFQKEYIPINDIADYISNEKVDILCMQEYTPNLYSDEETRNAFGNFDDMALRKSSLNEIGLVIYSKFPIMASGILRFHDSANGAVWADVSISENKIIRVINVHMQTTGLKNVLHLGILGSAMNLTDNAKIRASQVKLVRNLIDTTKHPVILAGDFNDLPSTYTFRTLKGELRDGFFYGGLGTAGTYKGKFSFLRIDNILSSKSIKCTKYYSDKKEWSDHNPIIAEFAIKD